MITNRSYTLSRDLFSGSGPVVPRIEAALGYDALRWYVSAMSDDTVTVEATFAEARFGGGLPDDLEERAHARASSNAVVVSVVPTGIGCEIGGYAGDAGPATAVLAAACDHLVTNPNALNASNFINLTGNTVYTEGAAIDRFCRGVASLHLPYRNRIGLVVEASSADTLDLVFNIANAMRAIHGLDMVAPVVTATPIGARFEQTPSGAIVGALDDPLPLFEACARVVAEGATAIAIASVVTDISPQLYVEHFAGRASNPVGGAEAVISHLVTGRFGLPAAHAPLLNQQMLALHDPVVDPRGAGEAVSVSGLASVLIGLRQAAQIRPIHNLPIRAVLSPHDVIAVVAPAGCLGGIPMLAAADRGIPVISVEDNRTILDVGSALRPGSSLAARSYAEAAGLILALRAGIAPASITRPLAPFLPNR